jgi:hypothetical protein
MFGAADKKPPARPQMILNPEASLNCFLKLESSSDVAMAQ